MSASVLDVNEGAKGDRVLVLDVPDDVLAPWEWIEVGKPYREFLVPADVLNRYRLLACIDVDAARDLSPGDLKDL